MKNITKENIDFREREMRLANENDKEDSMRYMAWYALVGMLIYPSLLIVCDIFHLNEALSHLTSIAEIYFISVSGLVSVYFGSNAYSKKRFNQHQSNYNSDLEN